MDSVVKQGGRVEFPAFIGERVYMQEFRKKDGLPVALKRWQKTVDSMLNEVDSDGPIYLMVDQAFVKAGATHRRAGLHIDGHWITGIQAHGSPGRPGHRHVHNGSGKEALILASDVIGCRAFDGQFHGEIYDGGDCSHIKIDGLREILMLPNHVYAGNVGMLHESLPVIADCQRTVVRLNVPGWHP